MSPDAFDLPRIVLLVAVGFGVVSCASDLEPAQPPQTVRPEHKKDYSALRIGGRQELQLPDIGIIHAGKREDVPGGEVLFSGRVFVEISSRFGNAEREGRPPFLYAYAEKARWNSLTNVLCLEGLSIVESANAVFVAKESGTRVLFDRTGRMTTQGAHEDSFYSR